MMALPRNTTPQLIMFDFDGVIADSEILASTILAEALSEAGYLISMNEIIQRFVGVRPKETYARIEESLQKPLPDNFATRLHELRHIRFAKELKAVEGIRTYIETFPNLKRCIVSQSSSDYLDFCLKTLKLQDLFAGHVFSAEHLEKGKPAPDVYINAAQKMNILPQHSLVIEDSIIGIQAGVAAGAKVIGFLGASHKKASEAAELLEAGAHFIAHDFSKAAEITRALMEK